MRGRAACPRGEGAVVAGSIVGALVAEEGSGLVGIGLRFGFQFGFGFRFRFRLGLGLGLGGDMSGSVSVKL